MFSRQNEQLQQLKVMGREMVGVILKIEGHGERGGEVSELDSFFHSNMTEHFSVMVQSLARCRGPEIDLTGWDRPANM